MAEVNYTYKRNKKGDTVHRSGCGLVKVGIRWNWADGMSESQLRVKLEAFGVSYRFCKVCFGDPMSDEAERLELRRLLEEAQGG